MEALYEDAILHIIESTPFEDIDKLCKTSRRYASLCATSEVWRLPLNRDAALVEPHSATVSSAIDEVMRRRRVLIVDREVYIEVLTLLGDVMVGSQNYIPLKYAVYRAALLGYDDILEILLQMPTSPQIFPLEAYSLAGKYVRLISGADEPHRLRDVSEVEEIAPTPEALAIAAVLTLNMKLVNNYIRDFIEEDEANEHKNSRTLAYAAAELLYDPETVRGRTEGYRLEVLRLDFANEFLSAIDVPRINIDKIPGADIGGRENRSLVDLMLVRRFIDPVNVLNMVRGASSVWLLDDPGVSLELAARSILLRHAQVDAVFLLSYILQKYEGDSVYKLMFVEELQLSHFQILEQVFSAWLNNPEEYKDLLLRLAESPGLANTRAVARYVFDKTDLVEPPPEIKGRDRRVLLSRK